MIKQIQIWFVFGLVLVSIKFFDALFINKSLVNYLQYLGIIIAVLLSIPYILPKNRGFVFSVQLLFVTIVLSVFMSYAYWDQTLIQGLIATAPFMIIIFFFYLLQKKISVEVLEKIIVCFGVLYILLFFYQFIKSPEVLFRSAWGDAFDESRGIVRIVFPGGGVFILSSFIALTKLTSQERPRWFWATLTILGLILPVMQVTRQFIAGMLLIYLFHVIRHLSISKKITIIFSFSLIVIYLLNSNIPVIQGIMQTSKGDMNAGADYIRVLAGQYFLTDFSPNTITKIFGNGVPNTAESDYGLFTEMLSTNQYYYLSDVGIIAVYAMFGIGAILGFIIIWVKSFTIPLPKEYYYLKYYLWFLLLTSLTWYSTYHYHYLIMTVLVLYMYQRIYEKEKSRALEVEIK